MKKFEMAVKTGTYQTQSGEKGRYENIGEVHSGKEGVFYARMNPYRMVGIAMAAIARGDDSIMVSMFEPREQQTQVRQNEQPRDNFSDDIPF